MGLDVVGVEADAGIMGGSMTHEIAFPTPIGEDVVLLCPTGDYAASAEAAAVAVYPDAPCPRCGSPLQRTRAVEVGHLFQLGTRYSKALRASFLDEQGQSREIVMASYGIGVGRLIACLAEAHHDERGLIWPVAVAPYAVCLVGVDLDRPDIHAAAEELYGALRAAGVDVLYDDRAESAGVKLTDADLLGMPLRLTVGRRALQRGAVELRVRAGGEARDLPLAAAPAEVLQVLERLAVPSPV